MNRRTLLSMLTSFPLTAHAVFAAAGEFDLDAAPDKSKQSAGSDQCRYQLTLDRVLHGTGPSYTLDFLLEDVRATPGRRFTNFCGDLSGRWIGALAVSSRTFGQSFPTLHEVVKQTIALQHPEGYFGGKFQFEQPSDDDLALLWGNGRLLTGLLEYYQLTGDANVLAASRKLGDFLVRIAPRFNSQQMADAFSADHYASSYICWTQQTEGLAALYGVTRDEHYRQVCAAIASRIVRRPGDHVHGYLTSLRGVLALYRETGDRAMLQQVVAAWQEIKRSGDLLLTGGVPERWTPKRERTEGCAECDWLRLSLALYRATGAQEYLDTAQVTYFNEFQMNQFATGDFGHARLDPKGAPQSVFIRAWWCCTLHGLRTFADLQNAAFRVVGNHVSFDLPIDSQVTVDGFAAEARSELATARRVTITICGARPDHALRIAQPAWAESVKLTRNGAAVPGLTLAGLVKGDVIQVTYGMKLCVAEAGKALVSVHLGPWLMGIAASENPNYFNEMHLQNIFDLTTLSGAEVVGKGNFAVPAAGASMRYTPAEFPEQPAFAVLRPVATQTGNQPELWQLAFATLPHGDAKG